MKKKIFNIAIVLVIVLLIFSYIHIPGYDIDGVSDISSECKVTITENYHKGEKARVYTLNEEQIKQIKTLMLESHFMIAFTRFISVKSGTSRHSIRVEYNDGRDPLKIDIIGNIYIKVLNQFRGMYLKNKNSNFERTIEEIIKLSN